MFLDTEWSVRPDQFTKRPFSKLKRDILEKLEIVLPEMMNEKI